MTTLIDSARVRWSAPDPMRYLLLGQLALLAGCGRDLSVPPPKAPPAVGIAVFAPHGAWAVQVATTAGQAQAAAAFQFLGLFRGAGEARRLVTAVFDPDTGDTGAEVGVIPMPAGASSMVPFGSSERMLIVDADTDRLLLLE